jgi:RHS repeat-associated protein
MGLLGMARIKINNFTIKSCKGVSEYTSPCLLGINSGGLKYEIRIDLKQANIISQIRKNIKVTNATLELVVKENRLFSSNSRGFEVKINNEIVDYLKKPGIDKKLHINITEEMNEIVKGNTSSAILTIATANLSNEEDNLILESTQSLIFIDYIPEELMFENNSYHVDNCKRAGTGKINLANGNLNFVHYDMNTKGIGSPIDIQHVYNTFQAGKVNDNLESNYNQLKIDNFYCGKGWKLNIQQFLVKTIPFDFEKNAEIYTYIDGNGNHHEFLEKFYYLENKEKVYLLKKDVNMNDDETCYYDKGGTIIEVTKEVVTTSGLQIIPEKEGYKNIKEFEVRNEYLGQLEDEIEELKKYRENLVTSLNQMERSKVLFNEAREITNLQTRIDKKEYIYQPRNKSLSLMEKEIKDRHYDLKIHSDFFWEQSTYTNQDFRGVYYTYDDFGRKFYYNKIYEINYTKPSDTDALTKYHDYKRSDFQYNQLVYNHQKITEGLSKDLNNAYDAARAEVITKNTAYSSADYDFQISKMNMEIENCNNNLERVDEQLKLKQRIYNETSLQIPINFIKSNDDIIMGFNKSGRFIYSIDKNENNLYIEYLQDRIEKIISNEKFITKFYYEQNKLSKILNSQSQSIEFYYDEYERLKKIYYGDNNYTSFSYDQNHKLIEVVEPSGYGITYEYINEKVAKSKEITYAASISKDSCKLLEESGRYLINNYYQMIYHNHHFTSLVDHNGLTVNYYFDLLGRPTTIYTENDNKTIKTLSIDYYSNYRSFSITPDYQSENILTNIWLDSKSVTGGISPLINGPLTVSKIYQNIDVSKINRKTDLVLSGFAKGDSAFINRERKTDYSFSEIDQEHIDNFDEYKKSRRFELRAEITYTDGSMDEQYCSFDWLNTEWQHIAFPITFKEAPVNVSKLPGDLPFVLDGSTEVASVKIIADYSYNTNSVIFKDIKLTEGDWTYSEFNNEGLKVYECDSENQGEAVFKYDQNKNLIEEKYIDSNKKEHLNKYVYDANNLLVRSTDYNGIVSHTIYNDEGKNTGSVTYHKDNPTSKYYIETIYDDKQRIIAEVDPRGKVNGEEIKKSYEYLYGTDTVTKVTNPNNQELVYGYDNDTDDLLSISTDVDDEKNANILKYNKGYLTNYTSNEVDYDFEYDGFGRRTNVDIAGINYQRTTIDDINNKTKVIYGNNQGFEIRKDKYGKTTGTYTIDSLGVLHNHLVNSYDNYDNLFKVIDYSNGGNIEYTYTRDKKGKPLSLSFSENSKSVIYSNNYGNKSELKTSTITIGSEIKNYSYQYDQTHDAKLIAINLPNGSKQEIEYDNLGRIKKLKLGNDLLSHQFSYLSNGDHTTNLISNVQYAYNGITRENHKYAYDKCNNITRITENGNLLVRYSYDSLNRLVREDNKRLNFTKKYAYDSNGNITLKRTFLFTIDETNEEGVLISYGYKDTGWKDQLIRYNNETFTYDAIGNPTVYRDKSLQWANGRELKVYNGISFEYSASGIRKSKTVNGVKTYYYTNGNKIVKQEKSGENVWFYYGNNGIIGLNHNNQEYIYQKNIQGDITHIYDLSGNVKAKYVYDAWGNHKVYDSNDQINTNSSFIGNINPFRYRGYYYDVETSLYYCNSRYYDPEVGRFINADDISYLDPSSVNGLNLYAYCGNNPIMYVDPDGHMPKWLTWTLAGVAVVGLAALTVVSFGIAAPLGITVAVGIGIGAGIGAGTAILSGKDFEGVVLAAISGGVIGGAMGFASGLGLMAGASFLGGTTTIATAGIGASISIGGALGIATLTGGTAYALSYSIDTGANDREFSWGKLAVNFALGTVMGASNFGIGFMFGNAGMGYGQLNSIYDKFAFHTSNTIFKSIAFGGLSWAMRQVLS